MKKFRSKKNNANIAYTLGISEMCRRTKRKKYEEEQSTGDSAESGGKKRMPRKRLGIVDVFSAAGRADASTPVTKKENPLCLFVRALRSSRLSRRSSPFWLCFRNGPRRPLRRAESPMSLPCRERRMISTGDRRSVFGVFLESPERKSFIGPSGFDAHGRSDST